MNNRDYKQFSAGQYYHVYNRGNDKRILYYDDDDYKFFVTRIQQNIFPEDENDRWHRPMLAPKSFSIICYSLMPNHFHILIRQDSDIPLTKIMSRICTSYAKYFNKKYKKVGHLFQDQYKAVLIDDNEYLKWISAYIHTNATVAGIINKPEKYKWCSYGEYIGATRYGLCDTNIVLSQFKNRDEYNRFVEDSYDLIKNKKEGEKELENMLID